MLSHALHDHLEEEVGVLQKTSDDEVVGLLRQQDRLQVTHQLLVNRLAGGQHLRQVDVLQEKNCQKKLSKKVVNKNCQQNCQQKIVKKNCLKKIVKKKLSKNVDEQTN